MDRIGAKCTQRSGTRTPRCGARISEPYAVGAYRNDAAVFLGEDRIVGGADGTSGNIGVLDRPARSQILADCEPAACCDIDEGGIRLKRDAIRGAARLARHWVGRG